MSKPFIIPKYYNDNVKPEDLERLGKMLTELNEMLTEVEKFAIERGLDFRADFGYGGRATFTNHSVDFLDEYGVDYDRAQITKDEYGDEVAAAWITSSMGC